MVLTCAQLIFIIYYLRNTSGTQNIPRYTQGQREIIGSGVIRNSFHKYCGGYTVIIHVVKVQCVLF